MCGINIYAASVLLYLHMDVQLFPYPYVNSLPYMKDSRCTCVSQHLNSVTCIFFYFMYFDASTALYDNVYSGAKLGVISGAPPRDTILWGLSLQF